MKALDGGWEVVGIEIGGKKVEVSKGSPDKIVIKGGKITIWAQDKPFAIFEDGKLVLDLKKTPKALDIALPGGPTVPCIYEVKDNDLKLAIPRAPDRPDERLARPQSFDTQGKAVILLITIRSKG
ncbi:hypothetical protein AYO44_16695 [Planctomycetaceae bacterium SCGC AG-212-F19]|nr:hypothetical protein AYO44_16695 [Planctomycetaceae bacterium SCGC AG-212-F19]